MHHDRHPGNELLDFFDHVEVQTLLAFEFVSAMTRADGGRERVAAGPLYELDGLLWIGERGVAFVHLDVLLDAP